jgi:hypothetical protein
VREGAAAALPPESVFTRDPPQRKPAWFGVFAGLESATVKEKANNIDVTASLSGWQAGIQGGYDLEATHAFSWGPFASFAVAQYGSSKVTAGDSPSSRDIQKTAAHQWLTVGVRGTYGL